MKRLVPLLFLLLLISCIDYVDELPGKYYYYSEGPTDQIITPHGYKAGEPYIPCNVVNYDIDDDFIIARQVATEYCFWGGRNSLDQEIGVEYFWVIDAIQEIIYGPLGKLDFEQKVKDLKISLDSDFYTDFY